MSAVAPQVGSVREGVWRRVLCHGLGRMVNKLIMPPGPLHSHGHDGDLLGLLPRVCRRYLDVLRRCRGGGCLASHGGVCIAYSRLGRCGTVLVTSVILQE